MIFFYIIVWSFDFFSLDEDEKMRERERERERFPHPFPLYFFTCTVLYLLYYNSLTILKFDEIYKL